MLPTVHTLTQLSVLDATPRPPLWLWASCSKRPPTARWACRRCSWPRRSPTSSSASSPAHPCSSSASLVWQWGSSRLLFLVSVIHIFLIIINTVLWWIEHVMLFLNRETSNNAAGRAHDVCARPWSKGTTVVYIKLLVTWCDRLGVDFLPFYAASGLWCALFVVVAAAADAASLARHAGRFTEELLAALVSFIFMYSALVEVRAAAAASSGEDVVPQPDASLPSSSSSSSSSTSSSSPDVFLKHLMLFFGTFAAARQVESDLEGTTRGDACSSRYWYSCAPPPRHFASFSMLTNTFNPKHRSLLRCRYNKNVFILLEILGNN